MKNYLNLKGKLTDCSDPMVMGILNLTPDSFYDGGKNNGDIAALNRTEAMVHEGAGIIDIGAQSSRPGATLLSPSEEWERLEKPLKMIRKEFPNVALSIDTFYSEIAMKAAGEGIDIINDISGGEMDEKMIAAAASLKLPYVLMHMQGRPQTMQKNPHYNDILSEIILFFSRKIERLLEAGVQDIIIDPGFGFGKTADHNFQLLSRLELFSIFERPLMAGLSRKSMIGKITGSTTEHSLNGTTVLNTVALLKGAGILRVHDVKEAVEAVKLTKHLIKK